MYSYIEALTHILVYVYTYIQLQKCVKSKYLLPSRIFFSTLSFKWPTDTSLSILVLLKWLDNREQTLVFSLSFMLIFLGVILENMFANIFN